MLHQTPAGLHRSSSCDSGSLFLCPEELRLLCLKPHCSFHKLNSMSQRYELLCSSSKFAARVLAVPLRALTTSCTPMMSTRSGAASTLVCCPPDVPESLFTVPKSRTVRNQKCLPTKQKSPQRLIHFVEFQGSQKSFWRPAVTTLHEIFAFKNAQTRIVLCICTVVLLTEDVRMNRVLGVGQQFSQGREQVLVIVTLEAKFCR